MYEVSSITYDNVLKVSFPVGLSYTSALCLSYQSSLDILVYVRPKVDLAHSQNRFIVCTQTYHNMNDFDVLTLDSHINI